MIMNNEEQFVMVPVRLSSEQASLVGPIVAHDWGIIIQHAGTPIQPCADVETVGWGRETSFVDLKVPGCHAVSIHKEWEGGVPLVRRADMEAQVAKVVAEKDAEIARLRGILTEIAESDGIDNALDPDRNKRIAYQNLQTDLNEGSGA